MTADVPPPTGLGRRSQRLSDRETEHRMMQAATAMIDREGLTVSLEHISFEDVIREAGVARSAVYRRWPYKDLFFSDLVKQLAKAAIPTPGDNAAIVESIRRVLTGRLEWLSSPDRRQALFAELFRQVALLDFENLYGSPQWRTYLALHATFNSLTEGELRDQVQSILAESQRGFITRVATAWQQLTELLGYRLRPELGVTFETVATLVSAHLRGLILMALSMPELATHRMPAQPFGATETADWSLPALSITSTALAFLEPDPATDWNEQRIAHVRAALATLTVPTP